MQFLDRLCIHQWDEDLKDLGVKSLGKVVATSHEIMVLWSPDYFERMWCVFELATFAASNHSARDILLLPLWKTPFIYGMLVGNLLVLLVSAFFVNGTLFLNMLHALGVARAVATYWAVCNVVPACAICLAIRR
eukprot:1923054-Amphidinium_carterae.1